MPEAKQSLNELLYDLKRIEEHREKLSEEKIRKIYKSLMKDLNAFIAEEYFLYADGEGVLSYATLQEKSREARFLEEVVKQVDSITPQIKTEMMNLVEQTYTNCYNGMANAVKNASNTQKLAAVITDTTLRPEVLKQAVNNNISKLTLPHVLEKNRQEIIYNIKQELTIGMINGDRYEKMARRISDKVDISYKKATNIVRTESHRNIESGLFDCAENISQGIEGSGLVNVCIWRTMKDERVRPNIRRKTKSGWKTYKSKNGADHQKMDGVTIRVGDKFELEAGVTTKCPGKSGVARHDCNCRCFLEYDVMTEEEFAKINVKSKNSVEKSNYSGIINSSPFRVFSSGEEVNRYFGGEGGLLERKKSVEQQWLKQLSDDEKQAVSYYCSDGYYDVNAYFRQVAGSEYIDVDAMKEFAADLDSAISKFELKDNITVYRGIDSDALKELDLDNLIGSIYEDKGYMSTSPIHAEIVDRKDALLEIQIPSGQGRGAYVNSLSGFKDDEYEFLVKRGTRCEVTSVDLTGDKPIIRMKVIDE